MDNPKDMQERAPAARNPECPTPLCACCEDLPAQRTASTGLASVLSALLDDMEDRYDGAPDSGSRWMGWHIAKGRKALEKAGSK